MGIHSYLAYLRDRLVVARNLLTDTGSIFVQIGDENVHLVRNLMDEGLGSENFISMITVSKTGSLTSDLLSSVADYLVWYGRDKSQAKYRKLFDDRAERDAEDYNADPLKSDGFRTGTTFDYIFNGQKFECNQTEHWKVTKEGLDLLAIADRLVPLKNSLRLKRFWEDFPVKEYTNIWHGMGGAADIIYVVQTNRRIIERCLLMTTDPGDLVLDPTCGSGTTAFVAEQWGRRWITIDTSRVAVTLARPRIMAARFPFYLLDDSPEGAKKDAENTGKMPPDRKYGGDVRQGFVYKRVPHVTLKSIANNAEIGEIHKRWNKKLEPVLEKLNRLLKTKWKEREVPRNADKDWSKEAKAALEEWLRLRLERQKEIDVSIARKTETELLYDQPYEDKKKIRVTGPFTVESLSPHRMLAADTKKPVGVAESNESNNRGQFVTTIVENLKTAGVQNTKKKERLKFSRLEPHAGTWIHAVGEYQEADKTRTVAVFIGPEHGTVGPEMVREAAKEAVQGIGFDTLIVGGFAFDPHVSEESTRFGKLTVLVARMNPDLAMGQELLKKTGAGNLFMIFGEPDIDIKKTKDGKIVVEIKGIDVYDPTTGVIRSNSTDDIACWFIDTDYNGESFFVRHAYFTGAEEPYEKLKRALKAEINEEAWRSLYTTKSRPFDVPKSKKIAVKVINHYGDEVLKVYQV
jgi:adenine-specific DNA-methyltransferase